jgi:carbon-monoxide dehydrogenase medium subunit
VNQQRERHTLQTVAEPQDLSELLHLRSTLGPNTMLLAGGTDLGVQMRRHLVHPRHLVSLTRVAELHRLELLRSEVVIGAAVTHRTIEDSPLFRGPLLALREACATVGSVQTRNVGTIVGNLCNASPAADTPPVLLAMGARVTLLGPLGTRTLPLSEFFVEYRKTALADDEVMTAVQVPVSGSPTGSAFVKLGRRLAMEISIACVGASISLGADGAITDIGIGLGSVAPISMRATDAEDELRGTRPTVETLQRAADAASAAARPVDDHRASASYRRAMVNVLTKRALNRALNRATDALGVSHE